MRLRLFLILVMSLFISTAHAHKNSDSYLKLKASGEKILVQWDIALRDLDQLVALDSDNDGKLTWGEVKSNHPQIAALALNRLAIKGDGQVCSYGKVEHLINNHSGYSYAVLRTTASCPTVPEKISVNYNLLFDIDSQHRGLLNLEVGDQRHLIVFSPEKKTAVIEASGSVVVAATSSFITYFIKGVEHLIGGIDHLLFLFVLLLPAILLKQSFLEIVKILTAFTVAHAITLTLSVLGLVKLPVTPVEIVIALSVAIAAVDNIWPILGKRRWLIAGGFGLIHGFGFANALGPLNLSPEALFSALLAFNLGLEAAQVFVAALLIPIGYYVFHERAGMAKFSLQSGSALAILVATLWTVDRSMGLEMMPF